VSQYKADMFRALEGLNVIDMEPLRCQGTGQ